MCHFKNNLSELVEGERERAMRRRTGWLVAYELDSLGAEPPLGICVKLFYMMMMTMIAFA